MMPQPYPVTPICGSCDGFAVAHITTGQTTPTGQRHTLPAVCPACHGTGTTTRTAPTPVTAGR
ncbi:MULTISPECIES: hypothetical protein [unclassified Streptomyces]|uniref:hypothetical protein n=1 Tax=unclassified Streptomyces TaxID=2593676 RepID=UPI00081E7DB7|nr:MULTISPECIES: hypothetical protein [unclassified Streptomyces]MYR25160.1 hypothetical protein [Streptomyces sp. SID4945]SCE75217.1 hypothetical protein GA0115257_101749 [Streptomyces sp. LcepLS]